MATYPGRDPLAEVMRGEITVRKFRVMVEHLPAGNALEAARGDGWTVDRWRGWAVESRLRELFALTRNINRGKGEPEMKVDYPPRPKTAGEAAREAADAALDAQVEAEMNARFAGR